MTELMPVTQEPTGWPEGPERHGSGRLLQRASLLGRYTAWALLTIALLMAVLGPLLAGRAASVQDLAVSSSGPSAGHLFGTDQLGRDLLARVVAGARTAVLGPLAIATATTVLSTLLGLCAGYLGGWADAVLSRLLDVVYALPPLLVAIVVVGVLGGGYWFGLLVLTVLHTPAGSRNMRAAALEQRSLPYVESARMLGQTRRRIMTHQVLPNVKPVVYATFFLAFTYSFVDLATLSFLGLGVAPGTADWGLLVAENRTLVFQNPWAVVAPLVAIVLTAVSANLVGQAIETKREAKGRQR